MPRDTFIPTQSWHWIENLIRRMSWQRYASLHLHFSDAEGFGLESKLYPWLNEGDYLTFDDLTGICETARRYHIEIIPELDSPGHLRYIIQRYAAHAMEEPDFTFEYQGETFSAADEGGSNTDWCYYVIRRDRRGGDIMDRTRKYCASQYIYEHWDPRNCAGPKQEETLIPEENYAGGYFCIWADSPDYKTAETVWEETEYRTWANAAKLWDHDISERLSYRQFRDRVETLRPFPGFGGNCEAKSTLPQPGKPQQIRIGRWEQIKRAVLTNYLTRTSPR